MAPTARNTRLGPMSGWANQRGRPALRVLALASAVVVTAVAAIWLPSAGSDSRVGTTAPAADPVAAAPTTPTPKGAETANAPTGDPSPSPPPPAASSPAAPPPLATG